MQETPVSDRVRHPMLMVLSILQYLFMVICFLDAIFSLPSIVDVLPILLIPYDQLLDQAIFGIPVEYTGVAIVTLYMGHALLKWYLIYGSFDLGRTCMEPKKYGRSLVTAFLELFIFPWGTLIGAITFITLLIPSVQEHFYYDIYEDGQRRERHW